MLHQVDDTKANVPFAVIYKFLSFYKKHSIEQFSVLPRVVLDILPVSVQIRVLQYVIACVVLLNHLKAIGQ